MEQTLQWILDSATARRLSVFVGSAVSYKEPSCAPSWFGFRDEILRAISRTLLDASNSSFRTSVDRLLESALRPETILEGIDRFGGMSRVLRFAGTLDCGKPNAHHAALAALAKGGFVQNILTTNWDAYMEDALWGQGDLRVINDARDLLGMASAVGQRLLLHLHGTTRAGFIQAGHFRLGLSLAPEVEAALLRILRENDCLFLGFSGNDWDVDAVLREALASSSSRLFWLQHTGTPIGSNAASLIGDFPAKVVSIEGDLTEFLSVLCRELRTSPAATDCSASPNRAEMLNDVAAGLGELSCLTLSFACGSLGFWKDAIQWCEYAEDIAYQMPSGQPLRGEVLRLSSACMSCAGSHDLAEFLLRRARGEYGVVEKSTATAVKIAIVTEFQEGLIDLCKGCPEDSADHLWGALTMLREAETGMILAVTPRKDFPMLNASVASLYAMTQAMSSLELSDALAINQMAYLSQCQVRNVWGVCSMLLSLGLCYFRQTKAADAEMALEDCVTMSRNAGISVCGEAAERNLRLLRNEGISHPIRDSAIVDNRTGWVLVPDPFCVFLQL